ncbi:hypothetical protein L1987_23289 [Smallanthus sonchifolius]|uniref:Uncharacterized protein n=1 Tax=Smallanthus sonchifolius TaxID=185202 RepID=A0ACB9IHS6_9ASTR|nr:hypothetical protein L1987_23289 [Smallanthus sonchifolius]
MAPTVFVIHFGLWPYPLLGYSTINIRLFSGLSSSSSDIEEVDVGNISLRLKLWETREERSPDAQKQLLDIFYQRRLDVGSGGGKSTPETIDLSSEIETWKQRLKSLAERDSEAQPEKTSR